MWGWGYGKLTEKLMEPGIFDDVSTSMCTSVHTVLVPPRVFSSTVAEYCTPVYGRSTVLVRYVYRPGPRRGILFTQFKKTDQWETGYRT